MTTSRWRRFLTGLTRPQFTYITVAAWFIIGCASASRIPQWALVLIAAGAGAGQVLLNRLASWLLNRHPGSTACP